MTSSPSPNRRPRPVREIKEDPEKEPATVFDAPEYEGPPIEVEGSTEYLRLILPSTEHPGYKQVLRLMREWSFLRDRNHSHWWWLRDSSKVLDFLATHQKELELDHEAEFTDNFRNLTSGIKRAELRASATETGDGAEVEVRIVAGDVPPDELEHALATGQNHVRHGQKVYLLTRELRTQATELQKRISGNPDALLLAGPAIGWKNFKPLRGGFPSGSRSPLPTTRPMEKTERRPRDLSALPSPSLDKSLESILRPYQKTGVAWLFTSFATDSEASSPTRWDSGRPSRPSAC